MEYTKKVLDDMRIKLNVREYSASWLRKHFRAMLDILYAMEEAKEKKS